MTPRPRGPRIFAFFVLVGVALTFWYFRRDPEDEPLDRVLLTMADRKYGCALVHHVGSENVIGIFTDTAALRFCGRLLRKQERKRAA